MMRENFRKGMLRARLSGFQLLDPLIQLKRTFQAFDTSKDLVVARFSHFILGVQSVILSF